MRALVIQISGLAGIASFFNHLWANASLERTLFVSLGVGLAVYFVLSLSDSIIRTIMASVPQENKVKEANVKSETEEPKKKENEIPDTAKV